MDESLIERPLRLALAGGGTGGHLAPGLHLLESAAVDPSIVLEDPLWFTSGRPVERTVLSAIDDDPCAPLRVALRLEPRGGGAPRAAGLVLRTPLAVARARTALSKQRSEVLLGLGGFTMLPAVLAARSLGIPVALLEINAVKGRATCRLASLARRTFHAWRASLPNGEESARDLYLGAPLAPRLRTLRSSPNSARARRAALGFVADRPLLVVVGGSQGAGALNAFMRMHDARLAAGGIQVLHQTGPGRIAEAAPARPGYRALQYLQPVDEALAAATGVLCRGGASSLAELAAIGTPAWVVPYPHHPDRHQERNARELGAGVRIVDEGALDGERADELARWLGPEGLATRTEMERALHGAVPEDAATRILAELRALAFDAGSNPAFSARAVSAGSDAELREPV